MKHKKIHHNLFLAVLLLILSTAPVFALDPELSPAGGGWLEIVKPGRYVFVEDHDDFDANLVDAATIEMWIYLKRAPKFRESWVLFHKEGSYMVTLSGHGIDPFGKLFPLTKDQIATFNSFFGYLGGRDRSARTKAKDDLPLNQWHHLAFTFGNKGNALYLNGWSQNALNIPPRPLNDTHFPLYIGGTGIFNTRFLANVKEKRIPFTGGLIDEVRVSDIARHNNLKVVIPHGRFKPDRNTLALWHFDGGRANWLKDASGNGYTLTDVSFPVEHRGKLPTLWGKIKRQRE